MVGGEAEAGGYFAIDKKKTQMSIGDAREIGPAGPKGVHHDKSSISKAFISNENATTRLEEPHAGTVANERSFKGTDMDDAQGARTVSGLPTPVTAIKTPLRQSKDDQSTNLDFAGALQSEDASFVNQ